MTDDMPPPDTDDMAQWTNAPDAKIPEAELFKQSAIFDKLIVMPMRRPEKTKGGIIISHVTHAKEQYMSHFGRLAAIGSLAYKHKKWALMGATPADVPKVGEWVAYHYHSILDRFEFKGTRFIIIGDEAPLMRLPANADPWDFTVIA